AALLPKDKRCRRIRRATEKLVPRRVVNRRKTSPFEHCVRLCIFLAKRVADDSMMLKELFDFHPCQRLSTIAFSRGPRASSRIAPVICRLPAPARSLYLFVLPDSILSRNLSRPGGCQQTS